jgi:hypothetical protein
MNDPDFPSLDEWPDNPPFGWVQWKGTKVCVDLHCRCGALCHADEDFLYHVKCVHCGQVYECGGIIKLYPLDHEPTGTIVVKDDFFDEMVEV